WPHAPGSARCPCAGARVLRAAACSARRVPDRWPWEEVTLLLSVIATGVPQTVLRGCNVKADIIAAGAASCFVFELNICSRFMRGQAAARGATTCVLSHGARL